MSAVVQMARLRHAVQRLVDSGVSNVVLTAALNSPQWSEGLVLRVLQELAAFSDRLVALGIDPALLAVASRARAGAVPRVAGPVCERSTLPRREVSVVDEAAASLDAASVLARSAGEPLVFDGTLDGLRGVPVGELAAVRGEAGDRLAAAGIASVYDVLLRVPLRYIDRRELLSVADVRPGMTNVAVAGTIADTPAADYGKGIARFVVADRGRRLVVIFFNAAWRARQFRRGERVILVGDVTVWGDRDGRGGVLQMQSPLMESAGGQGRAVPPLLPVYPQSGKHDVSTWLLQRAAQEALQRIESLVDPVPEGIIAAAGRVSRLEAVQAMHVPESAVVARAGRDRLAYDELLRLQLALGVRREALRRLPCAQHAATGQLTGALLAGLSFAPTAAQRRAVVEIQRDMASGRPMNRLVQGDVGSGKTLVALLAMLTAVEAGSQAVLLAPTEILASQHHGEVQALCAPLGVRVGFFASRSRSRARSELLQAFARGEVDVVVGTHALLEREVQFARLGLIVVDEQHRFGVQQRAAMTTKGPAGVSPDVLVMTATPIPRTAALTAFGDVDMTVLDEMPPGRTPIVTSWVPAEVDLRDAGAVPWSVLREQVAAGRQAYVVCPLVRDSEKAQAAAAVETAAVLGVGALAGLRVGVVTGKQKKTERAEVMAQFEAGQLDVLVATTVIEVGVNVPNASVIVILDAAKFGMAQLHQLRGRVGRGQHASSCFLVGEARTDVGRARLEALVDSGDGFVLSERDLVLRGAGNLASTVQSGKRMMMVADLIEDAELMVQAREDAHTILDVSPDLARYPQLRGEVEAALGEDAQWLMHS